MKKIIAIAILLILCILTIPNTTTSDNMIVNMDNSECWDAYIVEDIPNLNTDNTNLTVAYVDIGTLETRSVIQLKDNYLSNDTEIGSAFLELHASTVDIAGQLSVNMSIYELFDNWNETEVTWNNRTSYDVWAVAGGHYNSTSVTFLEISSTGWHQFDITTVYRNWVNNGTKNLGLIFVLNGSLPSTVTIVFDSSEHTDTALRPRLNLTYTPSSTPPTPPPTANISSNTWSWIGYLNETSKTGATLYSEITNCTYLVMQNTTTGYYYTYGPGITESFTVEYGSAVCVLTSTDTTWDHT